MAFFAARQPILDTQKQLFGYELLFRTSSDNVFPDVDSEKATSKMIEGLQLELGLDKISKDKLAFINFTEQSILSAYPDMLPSSQIVVEVLENVTPSNAVLHALEKLHYDGYTIALDDFVHDERWESFYPICHIIKVDCQSITRAQLSELLAVKKKYPHLQLLAEKVETYDEFQQFMKLGFDLFQGYFFSRPEVIKSISLNSSQTLLSSILAEIIKPDADLIKIAKLFEVDVALSFKLLRYTQSPLFQRSRKIESIRQAVVMLGQKELERFVVLLFAATFGEGKPTELIKLSMHRAKFCELLANDTGFSTQVSSAFLVGMLSLIDAMLDTDKNDLISQMPLSDSIKEALLMHQGWLADFVSLCVFLENGDWAEIEKASSQWSVSYNDILRFYIESGDWVDQRLFEVF